MFYPLVIANDHALQLNIVTLLCCCAVLCCCVVVQLFITDLKVYVSTSLDDWYCCVRYFVNYGLLYDLVEYTVYNQPLFAS